MQQKSGWKKNCVNDSMALIGQTGAKSSMRTMRKCNDCILWVYRKFHMYDDHHKQQKQQQHERKKKQQRQTHLKPKYANYSLHDLMKIKICRSLNLTILMFPSMIDCPSHARALHHYRPQCSLWRRMIANLTATVTSVVTMILTIIHSPDVVWSARAANSI